MSVKLLIVFVCAAVGTCCGFFIMRNYRRSCEYYKDLCDLVGELRRNISYRRDSAATVLSRFKTDSSLLNRNICEYLTFARSKSEAPDISKGFLPAAAFGDINAFFTTLGKNDGNSQLDELEMYDKKFTMLCEKATVKSSKYGTLAVKLGFLFGLAVGVLFL